MEITREEFDRYRRVQYGGRYNMITEQTQARFAADLSRDKYLEILIHYAELEAKYGRYREPIHGD